MSNQNVSDTMKQEKNIYELHGKKYIKIQGKCAKSIYLIIGLLARSTMRKSISTLIPFCGYPTFNEIINKISMVLFILRRNKCELLYVI